MEIGKLASGAKYPIDELFQTVLIFGILIVSQIHKIVKIC